MMLELIKLQRGCLATAVLILEKDAELLSPSLTMEATINDNILFTCSLGNPVFKRQLEKMKEGEETVYFIIKAIDQLTEDEQEKYIGLVKNREFQGYFLPENVILVFTIEKQENVKKVAKDLYSFCVSVF